MKNILNNEHVAVIKAKDNDYCSEPPYSPAVSYPEYPFGSDTGHNGANNGYEAVRDTFKILGMDRDHYGTPQWNPLGELVYPGNRVVIKPNLVSLHRKGGENYAVITHPSVIRAVCDYVLIALKGSGKLSIADAPQADSDFAEILKITKLQEMVRFLQKRTSVKIELIDMRQLVVGNYEDSSTRRRGKGDPEGYSVVDLGKYSEFAACPGLDKIYGADFDRRETLEHHNGRRNEYCIANTVLKADVIINIPKMKTHRKAGVTLSMKNLVGINGNKNYLPHYRIGTYEDGGDEYDKLEDGQKMVLYSKRVLMEKLLTRKNRIFDLLYQFLRRGYGRIRKKKKNETVSAGDWYGNDTIWRTVIDLNRVLIYADKEGRIKDKPQKRYMSVIDGIWAGEGEGPMFPDLKKSGYIIAGFNPVTTDLVAVKMMGFDYKNIPLCCHPLEYIGKNYSICNVREAEIDVHSNDGKYDKYSSIDRKKEQFTATKGWKSVLNEM